MSKNTKKIDIEALHVDGIDICSLHVEKVGKFKHGMAP